jgi:thiol-disulfide isomerase/thioredoxin
MKTKFKFIFLLLFLSCANNFAQVQIGQTAPQIAISDYLLNSNNKDLNNKYVILEFWATWCKPCLEQVPHINDLKDKFDKNSDVVFVSITNEKPEKVMRTLNRVPFKTMVVTDQSGKTFKDFISDKDGNFSIPATLLIDNKGIIKWIGTPNELNESIIENFINDKPITLNNDNDTDISAVVTTIPNEERLVDTAYKVTYSKENKYSFILLEGSKKEFNFYENSIEKSGILIDLNKDLKAMFADLSKTYNSHISLPNEFESKNYSLFYKSDRYKSDENSFSDIKLNLLKTLNFSEKILFKKTEVYELKIIDNIKLQNSKNSQEKLKSDNTTNFVLLDITLPSLAKKLGDYYSKNIKCNLNTDVMFDLILAKSSIDKTIIDLNAYGLTLEKSYSDLEYFEYKIQE